VSLYVLLYSWCFFLSLPFCVYRKIQQVVRSVQASLPSCIASATFAQAELIPTLNPLSVDFSCLPQGLNLSRTVRSDQVQANSANSAKSANPEDLRMWHRRLTYLSYGGLRLLLPKELYSQKESTKAVCDICAKVKAKEIFQRKDPVRRATKPLELIHSDLCGPITPASKSGCRYYILYIDDVSRFSWVSFLRTKTAPEICKVFREFKALVELKFSARITRFRCDNGKGEYGNDAFRAILSEIGISFEPAPPYTQYKNAVSERMIQTHNAKARAMILDCSNRLPPSMWAEAVYTANYLHAWSEQRDGTFREAPREQAEAALPGDGHMLPID